MGEIPAPTAEPTAIAPAAVLKTPDASELCERTFREFGATGDGKTDDTKAVQIALAGRCAVDGEDLRYVVYRPIVLYESVAHLKDATFIQTGPWTQDLKTLHRRGGRALSPRNVKIQRRVMNGRSYGHIVASESGSYGE